VVKAEKPRFLPPWSDAYLIEEIGNDPNGPVHRTEARGDRALQGTSRSGLAGGAGGDHGGKHPQLFDTGEDFDADMELMKQNPAMQEWWTICDPLQQPLETRAPGEWWARMEPVFFHA